MWKPYNMVWKIPNGWGVNYSKNLVHVVEKDHGKISKKGQIFTPKSLKNHENQAK